MRDYGFRNEASSLFHELSSNHSGRDELAVVVIGDLDGYAHGLDLALTKRRNIRPGTRVTIPSSTA